ncbi:hypothetical protein [Neptunicella sp. SCSIO 80796]|uniref:hypothetical protein n=1 Tax=Neptunicella plasticusilytica TaxID=3117012 RepID=UPI003A4E42AB
MTAIQLLEKLGADSTFNKADLSQNDLDSLIKLGQSDDEVIPPLTHECPDDEDEDERDN